MEFPYFVIRLDRYLEPGIDPSDLFQLGKFQIKKETRLYPVNIMTDGGYPKDANSNGNKIKLHFNSLGGGVFIITHDQQLEDGEYLFLYTPKDITGHYKAYCFGVYNADT